MVHEVMVPKMHRREVLHVAHASPMAGHLGINKAYQKVLNHFYWPETQEECHTIL